MPLNTRSTSVSLSMAWAIAWRTRTSRSAGCGLPKPAPALSPISSKPPCCPSTVTIPSALERRSEHDLVDRRRAAPVVLVGDHAPVLALLPLGEREGARADAVEGVVLRDLVGGDVLVDVLGDDVDVERRKLGVGHLRRHDERRVVHRLRREVLDRREVVQPLLVASAVDRVRDVLGGERLAVRPLQAFVGALPRLGEPRDGLEVVGGLVRQRRVVEVPQLVRLDGVADGDVGAVELPDVADRQHDLLAVLVGSQRDGDGCKPDEHDRERGDDTTKSHHEPLLLLTPGMWTIISLSGRCVKSHAFPFG
jgi:hypothetical protein